MSAQTKTAPTDQLRQQHYNATVLSIEHVHRMLMKIRIRPDVGPLEYEPGQYTILALGAWEDRFDGPSQIDNEALQLKLINRAYSIACPLIDSQGNLVTCRDYDYLEFYITLVPRPDTDDPKRPPLTPRLFALNAGDRIHLGNKITGHYTLHHLQPHQNVILAATGTGEAPHNAMTAQLLAAGHTGKIASLTCVRKKEDAAYWEQQQVLNHQFPNYHYQLYTTREPENLDESHPGYIGKQYLQDALQPDSFQQVFGWQADPDNTHVFLCGNPDMIGIPQKNKTGELKFPEKMGLLQMLSERGFTINPHDPQVNVHYEKYW